MSSIIMNEIEYLSNKNLVLSVFGLAVVDYRNFEMIDRTIEYILKNKDY